MAILKRIRLLRTEVSPYCKLDELILDWDNDRHQAVEIENNCEPVNIIEALRQAAMLLENEHKNGMI